MLLQAETITRGVSELIFQLDLTLNYLYIYIYILDLYPTQVVSTVQSTLVVIEEALLSPLVTFLLQPIFLMLFIYYTDDFSERAVVSKNGVAS